MTNSSAKSNRPERSLDYSDSRSQQKRLMSRKAVPQEHKISLAGVFETAPNVAEARTPVKAVSPRPTPTSPRASPTPRTKPVTRINDDHFAAASVVVKSAEVQRGKKAAPYLRNKESKIVFGSD